MLLALAIIAALWRGRGPRSWREHRRRPALFVAIALVFGGLAFVNAWDAVTFSATLAATVAARNLRARSIPAAVAATGTYLAPLAVLAAVAYAPWYLEFHSQAGGFAVYTGEGTRPEHAFLQFGPLLLGALLVLVWALVRRGALRSAIAFVAALAVPALPLTFWVVVAAERDGLDSRGVDGWVTLAVLAAAVWLLTGAALALARRRPPAAFVAGLGALGALLLYGIELFLVRDLFFDSTPRFNTVFKLSYQAWIALSVAASVAVVTALRRAAPPVRPLLAAPALLLLAASLVYAVIALPNRTDGFGDAKGLDGLGYVARAVPAEYALVQWLAENADSGAIVVEATGRSWRRDGDGQPEVAGHRRIDYTDAGRVSVRTGLQTPIGWPGHELQWRGDAATGRAEIVRRQDLVDPRLYRRQRSGGACRPARA